jgi:hypothetical protein
VTYANPTASVGLSAVNGVASTAMRSDAAPQLDTSITPAWTGLHAFTKTPTSAYFAGNVGIGASTPVALLQVGTSPTPGLVVTASGNAGIGTTAPVARLEVAGTTSTISNSAGNLNLQPAGALYVSKDVYLSSGKKVILDSDDNSDTYIAHDKNTHVTSWYVDNVEVARAEP